MEYVTFTVKAPLVSKQAFEYDCRTFVIVMTNKTIFFLGIL